MGDTHNHGSEGKNILTAFYLNAGFSVVELIGGYLTNSVAIYSDALHDLGDSIALLFAYFAEKISKKQDDDKFTFGYRRFSVLSAFVNGLILLFGSMYVIYEAVLRISEPEPVHALGMLILSIIGASVNSYAAFRLSKTEGLNPKMVMFHLLEDVLGWVAVFIVSIVLLFKPLFILDSILSILISLVILRGVYKNVLKAGFIFLQKFPDNLELDIIKDKIENFNLVKGVHAFKGWSIDDTTYYLRFHVLIPGNTMMKEADSLKEKIKILLKDQNVNYSTIEFESDQCKELMKGHDFPTS